MVLVRLVLETVDAVTTGCMVPSRAAEEHHGAAAGKHGPVGRGADRQRFLGQAEPVVALGWWGEHLDIVGLWRATTTGRGAVTNREGIGTIRFVADGDFDDDIPIGRRPPAPADRPWRHPSEMAAEMRAARRRAARRIWGVGIGSALGGAMAVAAVWYLTDPGTDVQVVTQRVAVTPVESVAPRVTSADEWATEVASTARPATATIQSADGTYALAGAIAVHDDGYLLTSSRALDGATELLVHTHQGTVLNAVVLGYDRETDLSVLKTDGPVAPADVAAVPASDGDVVATIDPTGAASRAIVTDLAASATAVDGDLLVGLTSLDASRDDLPPGSPVVDSTGAVVGITTAADADAPVTIVPIEVANAVAHAIITEGRVWHAWLGVTVAATELDGVAVTAITAGGPAERAGLRLEDRVVAIDGEPIESAAALVGRLRHYRPGDVVELVIERPDASLVLDTTLDVDPADLIDEDAAG